MKTVNWLISTSKKYQFFPLREGLVYFQLYSIALATSGILLLKIFASSEL